MKSMITDSIIPFIQTEFNCPVIIKKTSTADSGQIAVVLIDEQEATLKRIRKKGNTIALEAANKNYDTKIYASNRIKIQGRLISLYRNFH